MNDKKGMYISERMLKLINNGGRTEALLDILQIDVDAVLKASETLENEEQKNSFLGKRYLELVDSLKELGIIN